MADPRGAPGKGETRRRKPAGGRWTENKRALFLGALAATANVRGAARAAGMGEGSAYALRKRDAEFARAWGNALCEGYARLEMLMLERAIAAMAGEEPCSNTGERAITLSERTILSLLTHHRQTVRELRGAETAPASDASDTARAQISERLRLMHERLNAIDGGE